MALEKFISADERSTVDGLDTGTIVLNSADTTPEELPTSDPFQGPKRLDSSRNDDCLKSTLQLAEPRDNVHGSEASPRSALNTKDSLTHQGGQRGGSGLSMSIPPRISLSGLKEFVPPYLDAFVKHQINRVSVEGQAWSNVV